MEKIKTLSQLGEELVNDRADEHEVQKIIALSTDEDIEVSRQALGVLRIYCERVKSRILEADIVEAAVRSINSKDGFTQRESILIIGAIGPRFDYALPHLAAQITRDNRETDVACLAAEFVGNYGPKARPYVSNFLDVLQYDSKNPPVKAGLRVRNEIVRILPKIAPHDQSVVNSLENELKDGEALYRLKVIRSLWKMNSEDSKYRKYLNDLVSDSDAAIAERARELDREISLQPSR